MAAVCGDPGDKSLEEATEVARTIVGDGESEIANMSGPDDFGPA